MYYFRSGTLVPYFSGEIIENEPVPFRTEASALNLLIAGERMRILLSLPSKRKAPASVLPNRKKPRVIN